VLGIDGPPAFWAFAALTCSPATARSTISRRACSSIAASAVISLFLSSEVPTIFFSTSSPIFSARRDGVVVGMIVRRNEAERHRSLRAGKYDDHGPSQHG
jgi:hypothetical protein